MNISFFSVCFLVAGFFLGKWWAERSKDKPLPAPSLDPELIFLKDLLDQKKKAADDAAAKAKELDALEKAKEKFKDLLGS